MAARGCRGRWNRMRIPRRKPRTSSSPGPLVAAAVGFTLIWCGVLGCRSPSRTACSSRSEPAGLIVTAIAIGALDRHQIALRKLADTDPLTGLINHGGFHITLERAIDQARSADRTGLAGPPGPGRLQAAQRHLRPPLRRRGAPQRRPDAPRGRSRQRHARPRRRRGVRAGASGNLCRLRLGDRRPRPAGALQGGCERRPALVLRGHRHLSRRRRRSRDALRARRRRPLCRQARGQAAYPLVRPPQSPADVQGREAFGAARADRSARRHSHRLPAGRFAGHRPDRRVRGSDKDRHRARQAGGHAVRGGERVGLGPTLEAAAIRQALQPIGRPPGPTSP